MIDNWNLRDTELKIEDLESIVSSISFPLNKSFTLV